MQVNLSPEELTALTDACQARVIALRDELAHTDQRDLRSELRFELDRMEAVLKNLELTKAGLAQKGYRQAG